jgi:hypothetical protein
MQPAARPPKTAFPLRYSQALTLPLDNMVSRRVVLLNVRIGEPTVAWLVAPMYVAPVDGQAWRVSRCRGPFIKSAATVSPLIANNNPAPTVVFVSLIR